MRQLEARLGTRPPERAREPQLERIRLPLERVAERRREHIRQRAGLVAGRQPGLIQELRLEPSPELRALAAEPQAALTRLQAALLRDEMFRSKAEDTRTFGLTARFARWIATACTLSMACAAGARS
jgi:hypothetical protein